MFKKLCFLRATVVQGDVNFLMFEVTAVYTDLHGNEYKGECHLALHSEVYKLIVGDLL
jgi:hypothetical protein